MTDNKRWHELHPRGLGDLLGTGAVRKVVESMEEMAGIGEAEVLRRL